MVIEYITKMQNHNHIWLMNNFIKFSIVLRNLIVLAVISKQRLFAKWTWLNLYNKILVIQEIRHMNLQS